MQNLFEQSQVEEILHRLDAAYPEAGCALHYDNQFQLLCAVMLSAQTTDISVNKVTPVLFQYYPDAASMAKADPAHLEEIIRSIGLYRNKSRNLIQMSAELDRKYGGLVPGSYEKLVALPGVGRKTANVVLAEGFGIQRIAVDTHVYRVANRIGLANSDNVLETEKELMNCIPETAWTRAHHLLIFHGRNCCTARRPKCEECPIAMLCRKRI